MCGVGGLQRPRTREINSMVFSGSHDGRAELLRGRETTKEAA